MEFSAANRRRPSRETSLGPGLAIRAQATQQQNRCLFPLKRAGWPIFLLYNFVVQVKKLRKKLFGLSKKYG